MRFTMHTMTLWHRIITASTPGMTTQKASDSKIESLERTMLAECLQRIGGTGRSESACRRLERRNTDLIESDEKDKRSDCNLSDQQSPLSGGRLSVLPGDTLIFHFIVSFHRLETVVEMRRPAPKPCPRQHKSPRKSQFPCCCR